MTHPPIRMSRNDEAAAKEGSEAVQIMVIQLRSVSQKICVNIAGKTECADLAESIVWAEVAGGCSRVAIL